MVDREKHEISEDFAEQKDASLQAKRDAWRGLLIPAVGSAAFLLLQWLMLSRHIVKKVFHGSIYVNR